MQPSANYLLENMKLQLDLHDKLLSIFDRKDRAVRERKIRGLEAVMAEEQGVVGKIRHLTEVRSVIMDRFIGLYSFLILRFETGSPVDGLFHIPQYPAAMPSF